jgi:hypothetical protein
VSTLQVFNAANVVGFGTDSALGGDYWIVKNGVKNKSKNT